MTSNHLQEINRIKLSPHEMNQVDLIAINEWCETDGAEKYHAFALWLLNNYTFAELDRRSNHPDWPAKTDFVLPKTLSVQECSEFLSGTLILRQLADRSPEFYRVIEALSTFAQYHAAAILSLAGKVAA